MASALSPGVDRSGGAGGSPMYGVAGAGSPAVGGGASALSFVTSSSGGAGGGLGSGIVGGAGAHSVGFGVAPSSPSVFGDSRSYRGDAMSHLDAAQARLVAWVRDRVRLKGLRPEMWTPDHDKIVAQFLYNPDVLRLVAYVSEEGRLVLLTPFSYLPVAPKCFAYFLRRDTSPVTLANVKTSIKFGMVNGGGMESLLRMMGGVYMPAVLQKESWPAGLKREFMGQIQRFMASLVETANQAKGKTVLYLPPETVPLDNPAAAATAKDLVHRLETTVQFWTRQVREVLSQQQDASSFSQSADTAGPLQELEFWRSRTVDLSSISEQLQQPGVERIVRVLRAAKSKYLTQFDDLARQIRTGSATAEENLRFLNTLAGVGQRLAEAAPSEIAALLPELLRRIRFVGEMCPYYVDRERLCGLLGKVSNEIIRRCTAAISLDALFEGDVLGVMRVLEDCLECGRQWRAAYDHIVEMVASSPAVRDGLVLAWDFEETAIFAHVNAFMQRCRDLMEIGEAQIQFARRSIPGSGERAPLPVFGGSKGAEIVQNLQTIESQFDDALALLRSRRDAMLDINASHWHETNGLFKSMVQELELMMTNVITRAFDGVTTVSGSVELIEAFATLARRTTVHRTVQQKAQDVWLLFTRRLRETKAYFDSHCDDPPLGPDEPHFSGNALWTRGLQLPLERDMELLRACHFLAACAEQDEAIRLYEDHMGSYENHIRKKYTEWMAEISGVDANALQERLRQPLLVRARSDDDPSLRAMEAARDRGTRYEKMGMLSRDKATGALENNFDRDLLRLFAEVHGWEKFGGKYLVPFFAADIKNNQRETLRQVRENVMVVVREYNHILESLPSDERKLFAAALKRLDSALNPALSRITWNSEPGPRDLFLRNIRTKCAEVQAVVDRFHALRDELNALVQRMASARFVDIVKNRIYSDVEFEREQLAHQERMQRRLADYHDTMKRILGTLYGFYRNDPPEIQREWCKFVRALDERVCRALRAAVKASLQDLTRAILGDGKSGDAAEQLPLFRMNLVLDRRELVYRPPFDSILSKVSLVSRFLLTVIKVVPRLIDALPHSIDTYRASKTAIEAAIAAAKSGGYGTSSATVLATATAAASASAAAAAAGGGGGGGGGAAGSGTGESKTAEDGGTVAGGEAGAEAGTEGGAGGGGGASAPSAASAAVADPLLSAATGEVGEESGLLNFFDIISEENEVLEPIMNLWHGMSRSAKDIESHPDKFKNTYRELWDKDDKLSRFTRKTLAPIYQEKLMRLRSFEDGVRTQDENSVNKGFVKIDHSLFKQAVIDLCEQGERDLLQVLHENAHANLRAVVGEMTTRSQKLGEVPHDLSHLLTLTNVLKDAREKRAEIEAEFAPINDLYNLLLANQEALPDAERLLKEGLPELWVQYQQTLETADDAIKRYKSSMKKDLQDSLTDFHGAVQSLRDDARSHLPYADTVSLEEAKRVLSEFESRIEGIRDRERRLGPGLKVFEIPSPEPPELVDVETEVAQLRKLWDLNEEWQASWNGWKTGQFDLLDPEKLEQQGLKFKQAVGKLRELKKWGIWVSVDQRVRDFLSTMPLISSLGSEAMRPRHWRALKDEIHVEFNEKGADFTLDSVFELGLFKHAEFIGELSERAQREQNIERDMESIREAWNHIDIVLVRHKDVYWRVSSTDDIQTQLENDMGTLSMVKGSKFYGAFKHVVDELESALSLVGEVMEMQLQVQRKWMYLESIFVGSEDIRIHLAAESRIFDLVNEAYKTATTRMVESPNALRACNQPGYLKQLTDMDDKLERIQKSLNSFLEKRRRDFPRFYFISDTDLLEILGQSSNPPGVQEYLKSCFEGIKELTLSKGSEDGSSDLWEARAMTSPDGETVKFESPLRLHGPVEKWLVSVEEMMRLSVRQKLGQTIMGYGEVKKTPMGMKKLAKIHEWIHKYPGQLLITTGMINFTRACEAALERFASGDPKALKKLVKGQKIFLVLLAGIVRGSMESLDRKKMNALITIELHSRDVMVRLQRGGCSSVKDFQWSSQLRFGWARGEGRDSAEAKYGHCFVEQSTSMLKFGYEYQGNNGRLVVTPLTDRCVLTLTTALYLYRGGAPAGPAGTGKTETVKDLGKNLAKYVVVFNCSDQMDYIQVGRLFSGLAQSGSWGCFDEFNRITIEVLSVVAQQVRSIMDALRAGVDNFLFMDDRIDIRPECGIFITMNPGYAGRTELPDNLKSLFRPVAMMVPDLQLISEVMLQAEGFATAAGLAEKIVTLYRLMMQQLSKQPHYDFGLRSLRGVLSCAGALKRRDPARSEELIALQAIRDMNLPKFIKEDKDLFVKLLGDLFPELEMPVSEAGVLGDAINQVLRERKLQEHPIILQKCIELRDSKETRHCNMLVGRSLSGKTVVWQALSAARTLLSERGVEGYTKVRVKAVNPKSVTMRELYGYFHPHSGEWTSGVLSTVFSEFAKDGKPDEKWLLLDGPVDTLWIESMNTVMDDNKILTLVNGDRIVMPPSMSLLFEVEDLNQASPATVSRAGMIYLDFVDLGWRPYVATWIERTFADLPAARAAEDSALYRALFDKYLPPMLELRRRTCTELVVTSEFNAVISLCNLLKACVLIPASECTRAAAGDQYPAYLEKWFAYCLVWSVGGALDDPSRRKFNDGLRELDPLFPPVGTVYDYYVEPAGREFKPWTERVPSAWRPPVGAPFSKIIVPTVDTVRNGFVVNSLVQARMAALVVGETGTGKTVLVQQLLDQLDREQYSKLLINFSAATTSMSVQDTIEAVLEKKPNNKSGPPGGRKLVVFVDDLNMPQKDAYGSQEPIELLRQWADYGGWYDRQKQFWRNIVDVQLVAAMGPPTSGRTVITDRLQSRFNVLNFTFPAEKDVRHIFESILGPHLAAFDEDVRMLPGPLVSATVGLYLRVSDSFLPTPTKAHYLFNLRDISKVVQGVLQASPSDFPTRESVLRLWVHECYRVFADRFINADDFNKFRLLVDEQMSKNLETYTDKVCEALENPRMGPVFASFLHGGEGFRYQEAANLDKLRRALEDQMLDYNDVPSNIKMDLVLFRDAIRHVCRIHRILALPRGNAMLVGVGGSGRQSLTRLASHVSGPMDVFQIEITKHYKLTQFRDDLKKLYDRTGVQGKPTVFLFSDTQLKEESFLEDINNILSSGEVPNLFGKDEKSTVVDAMRSIARGMSDVQDTADDLWKLFVERVRANLHVVLCMSPIGSGFRNRTRMYPSLVSCTTIDWFHEWPSDALEEVATRFLDDLVLVDPSVAAAAAAAAGGRAGGGAAAGRGGAAGGAAASAASAAGGGKAGGAAAAAASAAASAAAAATAATELAMKRAVATVFALIHKSVIESSRRMVLELKRYNYVTPTNYLELVKGYRGLLGEKRKSVGDSRDKLRNGLAKLDESRHLVEVMQVDLVKKKEVVARKSKECEEMLVDIMARQQVASEKEEIVKADKERIEKEATVARAIEKEATDELNKAMPILEEALRAVSRLDKSAVSELKAYPSPPALVQLTMEPIMIMFGGATDWASAKKKLSEADFFNQIGSYKSENMTSKMLKRLEAYVNNDLFDPARVATQSSAAAALCLWVRAAYEYAMVFREVEPKRERAEAARAMVEESMRKLAATEAELNKILTLLNSLKQAFETSTAEKEELEREAKALELKLDRASKLVSGLSGEKDRWQRSIGEFEGQMRNLPGDVLVAAAFLSYAGAFDTVYRSRLVAQWITGVQEAALPMSERFHFASFLARPVDVRQWNIQGLPADDFSTENGVIVARGRRWPLMIDPQGQANKWIKNMEKAELKVTDLKAKDFLKVLESCVSYGMPYLLQDVEEEVDPALEPVLAKAFNVRGTRKTIKIGDKEVDYADQFRFYLTTKLANPHYTPEISTKTTIVNFAVKEQGLEAQLLSVVCVKEQPKLEQKKNDLVVSVAHGRRTLVELEDRILFLLATSQGSLLDDAKLVDTLQASKVTAEEVQAQIQAAEETEAKIDATREGYRPVALRASLLYFVLNDLALVDPMYQFSLDAYVELFERSIEDSRVAMEREKAVSLSAVTATVGGGDAAELKRRIDGINEFHTFEVYKYACRGLFERHKLLLSMQICVRRLMSEGRVPRAEWDFFLKGGVVMDRSDQRPNPAADWLDAVSWDNVTELSKLDAFAGLAGSFESSPFEWQNWYLSAAPETNPLPGDWDSKLSELQRLVVLRCIRQDRVMFAASQFVANNLGPRFVDPPPFVLSDIYASSTNRTPLIFILSSGVDPTKELVDLADGAGRHLEYCSLGQGQAPVAAQMLKDGLRNGGWVFLQNCHLSISWMPALEKIIEAYCNGGDEEFPTPHPDFRLWLSSDPNPKFPISILQRGIKMTTEPPRGLKANLLRLYNLIDPKEFRDRCEAAPGVSYQRLLFSLCWFHSVLIERRKFKSLGWNIPYGFNFADFSFCDDIVAKYLALYRDKTPWDAIWYLVAEANYGGRITDDLDRRLCNVYVRQFFCEDVLHSTNYRLSELPDYYTPDDGDLDTYKAYIRGLPMVDHPGAFGQHPNADIQSAMEETRDLLDTVLSLQPRTVTEGGVSDESRVLAIAQDLKRQVPARFDAEGVRTSLRSRSDPEPLKVVLVQEVDRYNALLARMAVTLDGLEKGIQGFVVINAELEEIFRALLIGKVPDAWSFGYPSLKMLGTWMQDLQARIQQMRSWVDGDLPKVFWLSGFTYPSSLFTALLQVSARQHNVPINVLDYEFPVLEQAAEDISAAPAEGAYIRGMFLEGARWDIEGACLAEPEPMALYCPMPVIHFKPVEVKSGKRKVSRSVYECPLYLYPVRTGTRERPSFMRMVDLPSGAFPPEFWVKRGTALLLALAQ